MKKEIKEKVKDKNGIIIKAGDTISYKKHIFDVLEYAGFIKDMRGRLKIMERKSMFEGAIDDWLENLKGKEEEIEIIKGQAKIILNHKRV